MEALFTLFGSGGCGNNAAIGRNKRGMKSLFLRTAAIATCVGFLAGGIWAWSQIPACPQIATGRGAINPHEMRFGDAGLKYPENLNGGMPPRRLSEADVATAPLSDSKHGEKSLADLKNWRDIVGIFLIGISCMAAVSAGTGGGSIYVPIMTLVMGFTPHASTVMSQSLMCGGVLAGTLLNLCRRHPYADRPLVDLDLVIFLAPAQMAGVSFGMVVNHCLPAWLLVSALVVVLTIAVVQTIKQYKRLKRERVLAIKSHESSDSVPDVLEDVMQFAGEEPSLSLDTSAAFGMPSTTSPNAPPRLNPPQQKQEVRPSLGQAEEGPPEQDKRQRGSTCSKDSQLLTSTADGSYADGVFRAELVASPELREQGEASEIDVEAGCSQVAFDDPAATAGAVIYKPVLVPEGACAEVAPRERRNKGRMNRLRRARRRLREMQHRHDILKWFLVAAIWLVDISLGIMRGGKGSRVQLVPYCGWAYWLLYCTSAMVLLGCSYFQGASLYRLQRGKDEAAIRQVPGDLHFDLATVHLFFGQTILAGLVAGTVGIGSALVIGPIMLMKGMLPAVCTAVNTAVVLCSSSSAAVKSALGTTAPWDYCVFLFALCFVCAIIGKSIVDRMARKYDADHIVVLFLIIIMFASMAGMVAAGIIGLIHNITFQLLDATRSISTWLITGANIGTEIVSYETPHSLKWRQQRNQKCFYLLRAAYKDRIPCPEVGCPNSITPPHCGAPPASSRWSGRPWINRSSL